MVKINGSLLLSKPTSYLLKAYMEAKCSESRQMVILLGFDIQPSHYVYIVS